MRPVRNVATESPTVEVVVLRDGREVTRELCDTREDAALAVERWSVEHGVVHHRPEDIRDPSADEAAGDDDMVELGDERCNH